MHTILKLNHTYMTSQPTSIYPSFVRDTDSVCVARRGTHQILLIRRAVIINYVRCPSQEGQFVEPCLFAARHGPIRTVV